LIVDETGFKTLQPGEYLDVHSVTFQECWDLQGKDPGLKESYSSANKEPLPAGTYRVHLYIWEDNDPATFDVRVQGVLAEAGVVSGKAGEWKKLGPWIASVRDGALRVACSPGDANLSGLEIWRLKEN
jgi:hypothetical protein